MAMRRSRLALLALLGLLIAVLAIALGDRLSPTGREARHLKRGDGYFSQQQYREAIIEYQNVLRISPANAHAVRQLGLAHYQSGDLESALGHLLKARELQPADAEVQLKLASIYLRTRQPAKAREHAAAVLAREPSDLEALALWAAAATTAHDIDTATRYLERARASLRHKARFHRILAGLHVRSRNAGAAERALNDAVAAEPTSADAHIALGEFFTSRSDLAQAERALNVAVELEPTGWRARMALADVYIRARKSEEARRVLVDTTEKAPAYLPAWARLSEIAFTEGRYDESLKAIQVMLQRNPSSAEARFLRARTHLALRRTNDAVQDLQKVIEYDSRFAPAIYLLALADLQLGNTQQARRRLNEAIGIDPNFTDAILRLAELNTQVRAFQPAIESLESLIARQPGSVDALALLSRAYLAKGDSLKATDTARRIGTAAPKDPRGPYLTGLGLMSQGKRTEAAQQFEAALALAPASIEPMTVLVVDALSAKRSDVALDRVKQQIVRVPTSARLHELLGVVHARRGETALAEAAFLRALELDRSLISAYMALGHLYATTGRHSDALAKLGEALQANPNNLVALIRTGMLHEKQGDFAKAQEAYERALAREPRFPPAANNLAYLYAERGGNLETALRLAQIAREGAPDDPHVADTLGWILYRRGVYHAALSLLKESAAKLPENPEVHYHLGMAASQTGDREDARKALTRAISSPANFGGKQDAQRALEDLRKLR
jgi:tetratricopeptide (TPR) repeat protein